MREGGLGFLKLKITFKKTLLGSNNEKTEGVSVLYIEHTLICKLGGRKASIFNEQRPLRAPHTIETCFGIRKNETNLKFKIVRSLIHTSKVCRLVLHLSL